MDSCFLIRASTSMAKLLRRGAGLLTMSQANKSTSPVQFKTVIVEGNIASGKTELLRFFKQYGNAKITDEPIKKWRDGTGFNLLDLMYSDPARWSLTFQTYVQLTMLEAHNQRDGIKPGDIKILERSIYSAKYCFVENLCRSLMAKEEYAVLTAWFDWIIANAYCNVDLIVYLRTKPETVYQRLVKRSRPEERRVPLEYLQTLHSLHEDWLVHCKFPQPSRVQIIEADADLSELRHTYEALAKKIMTTTTDDGNDSSLLNGHGALSL